MFKRSRLLGTERIQSSAGVGDGSSLSDSVGLGGKANSWNLCLAVMRNGGSKSAPGDHRWRLRKIPVCSFLLLGFFVVLEIKPRILITLGKCFTM